MNHPTNLIAWLDNELPEAEAARVGQHVEACAECRDELCRFAEVSASIAQLQIRRTRAPWLALLPVAAAVALLFIAHAPPRPAAFKQPSNPTVLRVSIPVETVLPPGFLPPGTQLVADIDSTGSATSFDFLP